MAPSHLEPLRVVIDTSTALPVLTGEDVDNHWLVLLWQSNGITPMVNSETIEELKAKIIEASPTAKELQARRFLIKIMSRYEPWCETVPLATVPDAPQCRDANDQMFIDLAIAGEADILFTRDPDLLTMSPISTFRILDDRDGQPVLVAQERGATSPMTMTPARSSPFAAMARDPLHPDVIYRDERCFVVRDVNSRTPARPLITP